MQEQQGGGACVQEQHLLLMLLASHCNSVLVSSLTAQCVAHPVPGCSIEQTSPPSNDGSAVLLTCVDVHLTASVVTLDLVEARVVQG